MSLSDITEPDPTPVGNTELVEEQTETPKESVSPSPVSSETTTVSAPSVETPTNTPKAFLDLLLEKAVPISNQRVPRKLMIFSHPGMGKTSLLGQIPNNLIIDTEDGRTVLKENASSMAEGVLVLPFKTFEGLSMTVDEFQKDSPELAHIKTISIDTVNNLKKRGLAQILDRQHGINPRMNNKYIPGDEGREHQEVNEQVRQLIQGFMDSGRDVIISCHAKTFEYKTKQDTIRPDFSEGLGNTLMGMVDTVAYMYQAQIENEVHRVIKFTPTVGTATTPEIMCKTRIKNLAEIENMIDPTWDKIAELWKD